MDRRDFLKTTGAGRVLATVTSAAATNQTGGSPTGDRALWIDVLRRLADPVLTNLANGTLKARMPVELDAPGTFDAGGWLRIGLCGHQPGIGESYISTGSLYLCAVALLPLGLPASNLFWSAPSQPWTSAKAWAGKAFPIDHALAT